MAINLPRTTNKKPTRRPGTSEARGYGQMAESMAPSGVPHIGLSPDMAKSMGNIPNQYALRDAVDAGGPKINPLEHAVDMAARPEDLSQRIPPITLQDMIPPVTPENTQGALTPPITPGNTDLASMISPITGQNTQPDLASKIAPITAGNTQGGGGGGALGGMIPPITAGNTAGAPQGPDPRAALAAQMMASQSPRAQEANYTTSGRGWPGASSAIFGRR